MDDQEQLFSPETGNAQPEGSPPAPLSLLLAAGEHTNRLLADYLTGFRIVQEIVLLDDLEKALTEHKPDVVLVSRYLPGGRDLTVLLPALRRAAPNTRFTLLLGTPDRAGRNLVRLAAQYGIFNIVAGDELNPKELLAALTEDRSWADIAELMPEGFEDVIRRPADVIALERGEPERIEIIREIETVREVTVTVEVPRILDARYYAVWGPGCSGRSTVTANLAALLAARIGTSDKKSRISLLDLDTEGSGVGTFLGLPPEAEGLEPLARIGHLTGEAVRKQAVTAHGVDVIPSGPFVSQNLLAERFRANPVEAEAFAAHLLMAARGEYPILLLDLPAPLDHPFTFVSLLNAKEVLFVVRPGRAYLRRAISALDMAERCGIPRDKFRLVVNQAGHGIRPEEIAEALDLKPVTVIPADLPGYLEAETSGKPYALMKPQKAVRAWSHLADQVYREQGRHGGFLGLFGGRRRRGEEEANASHQPA